MKILVISHNSFSQTYNNGKTLSAIFSKFKKEELCQLYFTPIGRPDFDRCEHYYRICDKDAILSIVNRGLCGTSNVDEDYPSVSNNRKVKVNNATRFIRTIVWQLSSWFTGGLKDWIFS